MDINAKTDELPRLPGAALLLGTTLVSLDVTTPNETWRVLPEVNQPTLVDGTPVYPSISRDGRVVGCVRVKSSEPSRMAVATYTIPEKKWIEYVEAYRVEAVSISPDKSMIAFISNDRKGDPARLSILDTRTGMSHVVASEHVATDSAPTWSPGGERIAYQVVLSNGAEAGSKYLAAIDIIEVATGKTWRVGSGQNPAWSPSGEWIAYLDSSGNLDRTTQCMAAHPDGTDAHVLYTLPHHGIFSLQRYFVNAPVWSPDSKKLLLNELKNTEAWDQDIHLLDFATHKLTRKFKNTAAVRGWAEWN